MYKFEYTTQFKKDYKLLSDVDIVLIDDALAILGKEGTLPRYPYRTHKLKGQYADNYGSAYQAGFADDLV